MASRSTRVNTSMHIFFWRGLKGFIFFIFYVLHVRVVMLSIFSFLIFYMLVVILNTFGISCFSCFHFPCFLYFYVFFHNRNPFGSLFLDCQALLQNEGAYACAQGKAPWSLLDQTWLALALYRDSKDPLNDAEPLAPENCKHTAAALAQGSCHNHAQWLTSCKYHNLSSDSLVASAH